MSFHDRCKLLNSSPVQVAIHFQYRVEIFFKEIIVDGSLGKVTYHGIRVEFQVSGSPHTHYFLWVLNAPTLTADKLLIPERHKHPQIYVLVKLYQLYMKSKTCHKYKNQVYRFNFVNFFISRTIFAEPLPENMSENGKILLLQKQSDILTKIKDYIS